MKIKITATIILCVVLSLATVTAIFYFTPVSYMPNLQKPNSIEVRQTSTAGGTITETDAAFEKIIATFNASFSQNQLSAIFSGQTKGVSNQTASGELLTTTEAPAYSCYVQFDYVSGQKISINNHQQNVAINQVIVPVENTSGYREVKVYFKQVSAPSETTTYYYMTTLANQFDLYKLVNSLKFA